MAALSKLPRRLLWILIALIVLLLAIRVSAPMLIEQGIINWFEQQQLESEVGDIQIDLRNGSFGITGLKATKNGEQVLKLDKFSTRWSWSAILDSTVRVPSIKIDGLAFDIEQLDEGKLIIAGIDTSTLGDPATNEPEQNNNEPVQWAVALDQLELTNFDICYRQQDIHDYCTQFKQLEWQGNVDINLARLAEPDLPLFTRGRLDLEAFKIQNNLLDRDLVNLGALILHDVEIETPAMLSINQIALNSLSLLSREADELSPQVTRFEQITLAYVKLDGLQHLVIKEATIKDHEALLLKLPDKRLEIDEWITPVQTKPTTEETTNKKSGAFRYVIEKFNYESGKSIQYRDNSLKNPFIVNLNNIVINIDNIDSSKPGQDSNIKYSAKYAEHGEISLAGTVRPLQAKPSFNIAGKISGLDLRDISAFTSEAIGHSIKSGQLDADLKLIAEKNILDSEVDLKLHHFELTALSPEDEEKLNADFGFPLNSSLSLLKDDSNKIELKIPITGDLENPDFDANDAITQATSSAITSAIITYYTPFGLVMAVEGLIDLATALDFEPVTFEAGELVLDSSEQDKLKKLVQLMGERPGIHLTFCPFSNSADRQVILPETASVAIEQLKLEPEQVKQLVELGEARASSVKQFLVDQKIEASRLVLCAPEHAEGEGLSGVELSI